jgi:hypothetical protein
MTMAKMNTPFINVEISGWESHVSGIIVKESSQWILLNINPVDYVVDGFTVIFKKFIRNLKVKKEDMFKYQVIKSCDKIKSTRLITFDEDSIQLTKNIGRAYEILAIRREFDHEIQVGIYQKFQRGKLCVGSIKTNGRPDGKDNFDFDSIRAIEFDTDYLTSLRCYQRLRA